MNKLITTAIAIAMMMPATASAQDRQDRNDRSDRNDNNREVVAQTKAKSKAHKFNKGERFERSRAVNYRRVDHREHARLSAAPRGYTWVRAGNDALLVRLSNNIVIRIVSDIY